MKKFLITISTLVIFSLPAFAVAATNALPQMMTGQSTIYDQSGTNVLTYGGNSGNFAIFNTDNSAYGFQTSQLVGGMQCLMGPICFMLGTGPNGDTSAGTNRLMTSRTTITLTDGLTVDFDETPALFFGGINVSGDIFGTTLDYLKLWGKTLSHGTSGDGASWKLGSGYKTNVDSKIAWGSDQFDQYRAKVDALSDTGTKVTAADINMPTNKWLWGGANLSDVNETDKTKYPEGKVWVVDGDLTLNSSLNYFGKGTLILKSGNLLVKSGVNILPGADGQLGIIVLNGSCTFEGSNKVNAYVLCTNKFIVAGSNNNFTGSFVANKFDSTAASNTDFNSVSALAKDLPPGFMYLDAAQSQEVGNN